VFFYCTRYVKYWYIIRHFMQFVVIIQIFIAVLFSILLATAGLERRHFCYQNNSFYAGLAFRKVEVWQASLPVITIRSEITCQYNDNREPGSSVSVWLRAGRPGDRGSIQGKEKEFFLYPLCRDRLWGPPSLLYNGYRVPSPGVKRDQGVTLNTQFHLVPRSWMSRSYKSSPLAPLYVCCGTALPFIITTNQMKTAGETVPEQSCGPMCNRYISDNGQRHHSISIMKQWLP
jgi:hypothetical protein